MFNNTSASLVHAVQPAELGLRQKLAKRDGAGGGGGVVILRLIQFWNKICVTLCYAQLAETVARVARKINPSILYHVGKCRNCRRMLAELFCETDVESVDVEAPAAVDRTAGERGRKLLEKVSLKFGRLSLVRNSDTSNYYIASVNSWLLLTFVNGSHQSLDLTHDNKNRGVVGKEQHY